MSTGKNNIDELFKSKLGDYSLEAPEHVWKAIEARRSPLYRAINYFRARKGVATLSTLLVLISISSIALWYNTDEVLQPTKVVKTTPAANTNTPIQAANMNGGENSTETEIQTEFVAQNMAQTTANTVSTVNSNSTNTNSSSSIQNGGASTPPPANTNNAGEETTPPANTTNNQGNSTIPDETNTNNPQKNIEETLLTNEDNSTPLPQGEQPKQADMLAVGEPMADTDAEGTDKTEATDKNKGKQEVNVKPVYRLGKYTFDLYGGVDFAGRSLSNNGAPQSYIQAKQNAERFEMGKTLGFRLNYDATKYLTIRAGIQYTQLGEKLNFENKYNYTRIDTNTGIILDPVTQQPIGTETTIDTTNGTTVAKANASNTISFIDVPVQLEWKLYKTKKFSVFATTGAAFNLRFQQEGYQINPQLDGIHQLNANTTPYKATAGISLIGGVGINYQISPRYSVLFETTYRQGINSVMKSDAGMQQTYRIFSGSLGLRYRF